MEDEKKKPCPYERVWLWEINVWNLRVRKQNFVLLNWKTVSICEFKNIFYGFCMALYNEAEKKNENKNTHGEKKEKKKRESVWNT